VGVGTLATEGEVWDRPSFYPGKMIFSLEMACFGVFYKRYLLSVP